MIKEDCTQLEYEEFLIYVRDHIREYLLGRKPRLSIAQIELMPMHKNNGEVRQGLRIREEGKTCGPLLYLEDCYLSFQEGEPMAVLMSRIANAYLENREVKMELGPEQFRDFETVRDHIIFCLVNFEKNEERLKECPYRKLTDLAISYRLLSDQKSSGICTVLITNTLMNCWQVDEAQLYACAMENTRRCFPPVIKTVRSLFTENVEFCVSEGIDPQSERGRSSMDSLYVCTNECGINGASVICYPNVLADFARLIDGSFYVLPSSIHEVLLLPEISGLGTDALEEIVKQANETVVSKEEILSYGVYHYCRETGELKLA